MVNIQTLDPTASPLDYYGWELRRQRDYEELDWLIMTHLMG